MLDPVSIIRLLCSPIYLDSGSALFYHNLNYGPLDSISSSVNAEGAVCLHALRPFPEFSDCLLSSFFVGIGGFSPWDRERFKLSVRFILPDGWE